MNNEGKISEELTEDSLHKSDIKDDNIKYESSAYTSNIQLKSINGDMQTVEPSYMCDICGKEMSSLAAMSKHNKWHQDQESPSCLKCGIDFEDRISYRSHMRSHRGENPKQKNFTCETCGQNFVSNLVCGSTIKFMKVESFAVKPVAVHFMMKKTWVNTCVNILHAKYVI